MARIGSLSSSRELAAPPARTWTGDQHVVEQLTTLDGAGHWVVSCYLKLEPRDRSRGKYQIKLKNRIRGRTQWVSEQPIERVKREAIGRDLERVRQYLEDPSRLPASQGIAIFASEFHGLLAAIPLPHVYRSRLVVDRTPLVSELATVADDFGQVISAVYDRTSARLFRVTAFEVEELPSIPAVDTTRTSRFHGTSVAAGPGRGMAAAGEYGHHLRIQEEKQRHLATIAQALFDLSRTGVPRGIVLGGIGVDSEALLAHLHPYVHGLVLGTARLNVKTVSGAEVRQAVFEARRQAEQAQDEKLVREFEESLGSGWATNGIAPTLEALGLGQVRTLLIRGGASHPGFRCIKWDRLSLERDACDGPAIPVEDVIDDALEDALRQRSHIDVVEATHLAGKIDGMGALLRFKL